MDRFAFGTQDLAVGGEDQIVLNPIAVFRVTSAGQDGKFIRTLCMNSQIEIEGEGGSIECRSQVRRGRGKAEFQMLWARRLSVSTLFHDL